MHKTGTTTLETVLRSFGYNVYGGDKKLMKFKDRNELLLYVDAIFRNYDVVQDMPQPLFYKELYELFPNAKYILTYRDSESWIKSVVRYFAKIRIPLHRQIYDTPCAEGYEKKYLEFYIKLNSEIISFFENKNNFIILKVGENFNYQTLCQFIGLENVPNEPFPKSRKNAQYLSNFKLYRHIRSIYINKIKGY